MDHLHANGPPSFSGTYYCPGNLHGMETVHTRGSWLFVLGYGLVESLDLPLGQSQMVRFVGDHGIHGLAGDFETAAKRGP